PRQALDTLARLLSIETDKRGVAIQPDTIENIDFRSLDISGNADLIDSKPGSRGDSLQHAGGMPTCNHTADREAANQRSRQREHQIRRSLDLTRDEARDEARRPAHRARQHEPAITTSGHQRKQDASSTIQLNNSPNEYPA